MIDVIDSTPLSDASTPRQPNSQTQTPPATPRSDPEIPTTSNIKVYARIRPSNKHSPSSYSLNPSNNSISFHIPKDLATDYINNKQTSYTFQFHHTFTNISTQCDIFDTIGKTSIDSVLNGFNATIFAYGQTGSGKTFTITGGAERYDDRGIIPRTLSYLFQQISPTHKANNTRHNNTTTTTTSTLSHSIRISYLEIYNEKGYDLLDPSHATTELSSLPEVTLRQAESGAIHLSGLGELPVTTVDEALNLLFVGDTNRMVCETPSNDASSRSHCIFTINVETRDTTHSRIRRSKLHLVDLAGSERTKKTQVTGKLMKEASYINLSLHYLEQVIVALHHRHRGQHVHIPYRNSMMTSVLRDSLGGNCMTSMIATISVEAAHIDESISTARFAQRVAMIENSVKVNDEIDVNVLCGKLKVKVKQLKEEVSRLRGETVIEAELTDDDRQECKELVQKYITKPSSSTEYEWPIGSTKRITYCFSLMKEMLQQQPVTPYQLSSATDNATAYNNVTDVDELRQMIIARESDIRSLTSRLAQYESAVSSNAVTVQSTPMPSPPLSPASLARRQMQQLQSTWATSSASTDALALSSAASSITLPSSTTLMSRAAAFESFRRSHPQFSVMEAEKDSLRVAIATAKDYGERINACRQAINKDKSLIEQIRVRLGVRELNPSSSENDLENQHDQAELQEVLSSVDQNKSEYRKLFEDLKALKEEIETRKNLLEKNRRKLQREFEQNYAMEISTTTSPSATLIAESVSSPVSSQKTFLTAPAETEMKSLPIVSSASSTTILPKSQGLPSLPAIIDTGSRRQSGNATIGEMIASTTKTKLAPTGNARADADIARFYALRDQMLAAKGITNK